MHPMKFTPFARGQRSQHRMLRDRIAPSEFDIAPRDHAFHALYIFENFTSQLRDGSTSRQDIIRRFAADRKIPKPQDYPTLPALSASVNAGPGLPRRQATLAVLNCAAVG